MPGSDCTSGSLASYIDFESKQTQVLLEFGNGVIEIPDNNAPQANPAPQACIPVEVVNIMREFTKHNMDLAIWRRALLIALNFNLSNKEEVYDRLAREPKSMYDTLQKFFGTENANRFLEIMNERVITYRSMIEAMIAKNTTEVENSYRKQISLAEQLADFFFEVSPVYPREEWVNLLRTYEELMYQEAVSVVTGHFADEIQLFDRIEDQIYLIADHAANIIAAKLNRAPGNGILTPIPAPPTEPSAPAAPVPTSGVHITTAIWRLPGR